MNIHVYLLKPALTGTEALLSSLQIYKVCLFTQMYWQTDGIFTPTSRNEEMIHSSLFSSFYVTWTLPYSTSSTNARSNARGIGCSKAQFNAKVKISWSADYYNSKSFCHTEACLTKKCSFVIDQRYNHEGLGQKWKKRIGSWNRSFFYKENFLQQIWISCEVKTRGSKTN